MVQPIPEVRQAALRTIRHPATGTPLDKAVVLYFGAPRSESGEDVAEFQVHGGRAVVRAVLEALGTIKGCRPAEPGEFARRAFENGKVDLAEVEGLADLVDAETEAQRAQALKQSSGALSKLYEGWRVRLIEALALTEAAIDFSDEHDVAVSALEMAKARVVPLREEIARHLADGHRGEILRDGFRVALLGAPNAGKSSLLNALARREAAIVSEEAGTTRDVIEVRLDLGGYPVIVSDTAGLRETSGAVEQEGMRRSIAAASAANLVLWLIEPGGDVHVPAAVANGVSRETSEGSLWCVHTKADIPSPRKRGEGNASPHPEHAISVKTGAGLEELVRAIAAEAVARLGDDAGAPVLTQARHRRGLQDCLASLETFAAGDGLAPELRAEDLRRAAHAIARVTGRVDVEDVLDAIFGRFCVGK